ncbi:hypothetical protein [Hymenobacter ruricola]|uniref:Uncharacterized protein n=1 Tax=Hymenobacter ruricola TaxID=2791023 RepID=A0ABS0I1X1_9BACT|nr:hypothetical protein [Hymenobacter ruricola]MBF9220924.1 hypothetical protein [Hymenobacter ruricola]
MLTNLQQHFRFYLALILSALLALGIRLQAAPLGSAQMPVEQPARPPVAPAAAAVTAAR